VPVVKPFMGYGCANRSSIWATGVAAVRDRTRGPTPYPSPQGEVAKVPGPVANDATPGTHEENGELGRRTAYPNGCQAYHDKGNGGTIYHKWEGSGETPFF
jgi:hypothetical protein